MTTKQKAWYWREWNAVVKAAKAAGLTPPERHTLHVAALGRDKSMLDFTNPDLDLVIAEFRARSQDANVNAQVRQIRQPRTRLLWKLTNELPPLLAVVLDESWTGMPSDQTPDDQLAAAERYILAIVVDKFKSDTFLHLKDEQLAVLTVDVTRAINHRRKQRVPQMTWPDLREEVAKQFGPAANHAHAQAA